MTRLRDDATGSPQGTGLLVAYTALLVYGTWFPLSRWDWESGGLDQFLQMSLWQRAPLSDLIINSIIYVPLGALLANAMRKRPSATIGIAGIAGLGLSVFLELGQTYLPGRVTSLTDIILNTMGAVLGAAIVTKVWRSAAMADFSQRLVSELRRPGSGRLGVLAVFLWIASQWAPFIPTLDVSNLRNGLAPLTGFSSASPQVLLLRILAYTLMLTGLSAITLRLFKDRFATAKLLTTGVFIVLAGKVFIVSRQLSVEALIGAGLTSIFILRLRYFNSSTLRFTALACLIAFQLLDTLIPSTYDPLLRPMNWILFRGQMNSISGIVDLLGVIWLYAAYAYLLYPKRSRTLDGLALRLVAITTWALCLEWGQSMSPGRYPDITDVVVGIVTFTLCYSYPWRQQFYGARSHRREPRGGSRWSRTVIACTTGLSLIFLVGRLAPHAETEQYRLPADDELPQVLLPDFRYQHPRFEAPTSSEWALLNEKNPRFVKRIQQGADRGRFYDRILLARVSEEINIPEDLFNDLLALEFTWRGHGQTIPLALAYDWLYDRLNESQRARLLKKLELACDYQVQTIRDRLQLSPYNVYLYNQPLQALMMAAIAQHGDSTSGQCMRFANDYWKNRVLPVWAQVMGTNGGWHEGGEYVGIGIGSAVHRLPAMWRRATGEDLFQSMPGLRGFADFAVYRKQPDGSDIRLGDGGFHRKPIPDLAALAAEIGHSAAYTLADPDSAPHPLGFPWGTWNDNSLNNPDALESLPKVQWFDGIGLLVARSDWSEQASHITFKAGNNYWSHTHLDQGAFTLFKGKPLALDSGVYFQNEGEHHLNYMYQSVAHNVLTIIDPKENSILPGKSKRAKDGTLKKRADRKIANDGGQRRVGSGWGQPAPLDYRDWILQSETYRTVGRVLGNTDPESDVSWVNADLTPAYTNARSGTGDFWARSKRTDRYLRTFVYIRELDAVVVHDRVSLTNSNLQTKWLLHSTNKPAVTGSSELEIGTDVSKLSIDVLLPEASEISLVGGPGFEFFVDGKNYDEDGKAQTVLGRKAKQDIVPGEWRTEIMHATGQREHEYLIVLRPQLAIAQTSPLPLNVERTADHVILNIADRSILLPRGMEKVKTQ